MQAAGFVVRRWTTWWRRCWPTGKDADDFKRDSKAAFYSVLWKQHVYIAQVEVIEAALQMAQVNFMEEKDGRTSQEHATEAKNHFATWLQMWRQWSWTPCEAQTEGNFGMPPSKCHHLCYWPHNSGVHLAFLAQLCLGFHLCNRTHLGSLSFCLV